MKDEIPPDRPMEMLLDIGIDEQGLFHPEIKHLIGVI